MRLVYVLIMASAVISTIIYGIYTYLSILLVDRVMLSFWFIKLTKYQVVLAYMVSLISSLYILAVSIKCVLRRNNISETRVLAIIIIASILSLNILSLTYHTYQLIRNKFSIN